MERYLHDKMLETASLRSLVECALNLDVNNVELWIEWKRLAEIALKQRENVQ